jgi:hypothetical protein
MTNVHPISSSRLTPSSTKKAALGLVVVLLFLVVLGFPPPLGLETRPQSDVSIFWLLPFVVTWILEILTLPMIFKRPAVGGLLGIVSAILSILGVVADQAHLIQPEVAPFNYSILQGIIVITSLALVYFSWRLRQTAHAGSGLPAKPNDRTSPTERVAAIRSEQN